MLAKAGSRRVHFPCLNLSSRRNVTMTLSSSQKVRRLDRWLTHSDRHGSLHKTVEDLHEMAVSLCSLKDASSFGQTALRSPTRRMGQRQEE
eukprot:COSAG01_NODE_87_length_27454_cov_201.243575_27_plen_91_part_00